MKYLIDTNIFIEAHRGLLPVNIAESFWNKIKELGDNGIICSVSKVREELLSQEDDLAKWVKNNLNKNFFIEENDEILDRIKEIMEKVAKMDIYTKNAKGTFLRMDKADVYLVAVASLDTDTTIVTRETPNKDTSNLKNQIGKIKIPDMCIEFDAKYIQPADMFRELNEKF